MGSSDLARIKRLILLGQYRFTRKAELERLRDGLLQTDVLEAIISAPGIKKNPAFHQPVPGGPQRNSLHYRRVYL